MLRRTDAGSRDEGLTQVRRVTGWVAAGALVLTGVAAGLARNASAGSAPAPNPGSDTSAAPSLPSSGDSQSAPLPAPSPRELPAPHTSTRGS